jgi:DNA-binding HxlR family transcriptional regulator
MSPVIHRAAGVARNTATGPKASRAAAKKVTYSLTEMGESLAEPLCALLGWFGAHRDAMAAAQQHYDGRAG